MNFKKCYMFSLFLLMPFTDVNANIDDVIAELNNNKHTTISYKKEAKEVFFTPQQQSLFSAISNDLEGSKSSNYSLRSKALKSPGRLEDPFKLYSLSLTHWTPDNVIIDNFAPPAPIAATVLPEDIQEEAPKGVMILWSLTPLSESTQAMGDAAKEMHKACYLASLRTIISALQEKSEKIYVSENFGSDIKDIIKDMNLEVLKPNTGYTVMGNGDTYSLTTLKDFL